MSLKFKILIADDHHLIREGITNLFSKSKEFEIIGEAENGEEAFLKIKKLQPDLIIMDIAMPKMTGIEVTEKVKKEFPEIKVLILTMYENEEYILKMYEAGASGYILKSTKMDELFKAVDTITKGNLYFNNEVTQVMLKGMQEKKKEPLRENLKGDISILTDREIEIIRHIADGFSNKEIAEHLFISVRTVETHRKNLMKKLHVKNTAEIIKFSIHNKLVEY